MLELGVMAIPRLKKFRVSENHIVGKKNLKTIKC